MCLGVPLKIVKIKDNETALVSMGGSNIEISIVFTPDAREGDYVLVHAGFALRVLEKQDAMEIRELIGEMINEGRDKENTGSDS